MADISELALELLKRREAQTHFQKFAAYIEPLEPPADHHKLICDALDEVVNGEVDRLMIFLPPGSAKSTYTSVRFPPYYLGRFPGNSIICGSYGEGLSTSFGRKVRNILDTKEYKDIFTTTLAEDARAKGEWATKEGGSYFACGVGSGVTGRRADLGLIDDPVKGRKEADSELIRNEAWDWYTADFFSRLKPGAAQIIIQTRWHEDDLSGRILPSDWNGESGTFIGFDGQPWKVICLPAEARENDLLGRNPGDWLWPEYYTPKTWEKIKKVQTAKDTRNWTALYQQVPRPEQGTFFKRDWFKRYRLGEEPRLTLYGASDCGVSEEGDHTEHGVGGFDQHENLYFVDWWSGQTTMDVWIEEEMKLAKHWEKFHGGIMAWAKEVGQIRRASEPYLKKAKLKHRVSLRHVWLPHIGDKAANARSFQAMASEGRVYIPNCEWGDRVIDFLVKFIPNTNHQDDVPDVCGLFGRILDNVFTPSEPQKEEKHEIDTYGFDEEPEQNWKTA